MGEPGRQVRKRGIGPGMIHSVVEELTLRRLKLLALEIFAGQAHAPVRRAQILRGDRYGRRGLRVIHRVSNGMDQRDGPNMKLSLILSIERSLGKSITRGRINV